MSIMACVQMDTQTSMGTRIIKIAMTGFTFAGVKSIITIKGGFYEWTWEETLGGIHGFGS